MRRALDAFGPFKVIGPCLGELEQSALVSVGPWMTSLPKAVEEITLAEEPHRDSPVSDILVGCQCVRETEKVFLCAAHV